jgi:hypothetical protein
MGKNTVFKEPRHKVEVFLPTEEFEVLERLADKNKVSYSEYMRLCFMWDAVCSGDRQAIRLTTKRGLRKVWNKFRQYGLIQEMEFKEDMVK